MVKDQDLFIKLGPNEFIEDTDKIGLFASADEEPEQFLSVEELSNEKKLQESNAAKIEISLSNVKHTYERRSLTLMQIMGDLGGLYQAIFSVPSFFISKIIQNLFMNAVVDLTLTKKLDSTGGSRV